MQFASPEAVMRHAFAIAGRGIGRVEPNPAVGAVIVDDQLRLLGEGYHAEFGGPHAEVGALQQAGERARGATLFVTLEPCSHFGKTPPCAPAVVAAGVRKVFVAVEDPFPQVSGRGIQILKEAAIEVEVGLCETEAKRLIAPFAKLTTTGLPYVHAKWAMTIDGRIATASGDSKWISGFRARALVHELRGRMDAVAVGIETALADDPLLTARPSGPRNATRIVFDSHCRLPLSSKLATSSSAIPVIVVARHDAPEDRINALSDDDVEVLMMSADLIRPADIVKEALTELGRRRMTNILVEGGGRLLGAFFDAGLVDEAHVFIGPKVIGSDDARSPVAGSGVDAIADAKMFSLDHVERVDDDVYVRYVK